MDTPWWNEWHCHFAPIRSAGICNTLRMEAADVSSLPAVACSWVVGSIPNMAASGTLALRCCKGYISAPLVLGRQDHRATAEAPMKAWQSHPSSAITLPSSASILSLWVCCRTQGLVVWCTSASLILVVQCDFASLTLTAWHTSASLIASVSWASFMHTASSVLSSNSLWWESMVVLVVSSHSRATFICPCKWSTSSGSLAGSTLEGTWSCGMGKVVATFRIFSTVCRDGKWLTWAILETTSGVITHGDAWVGLAVREGMAGSSPFGLGDPLLLHLVAEPPGPPMAALLSILCRETGVNVAGKPAAAAPRPPGAASWWPQWCCKKIQQWLPERGSSGVVVAWMVVVMLSGWTLLRSYSISGGSWVGHLWQPHSRVVALQRWTAWPWALHLALLGIPTNSCVAWTFVLATDGASYRYLW